jgi:hypothetical protein
MLLESYLQLPFLNKCVRIQCLFTLTAFLLCSRSTVYVEISENRQQIVTPMASQAIQFTDLMVLATYCASFALFAVPVDKGERCESWRQSRSGRVCCTGLSYNAPPEPSKDAYVLSHLYDSGELAVLMWGFDPYCENCFRSRGCVAMETFATFPSSYTYSEGLYKHTVEDNQRVTYTYTVSADVTGLLSV